MYLREIYLDNAATTAVRKEVADFVYRLMCENYGNPSSLHLRGLQAELAVKTAKRQIAGALGCSEDCLYFTSGGTEANNTAVFGVSDAYKREGNTIATTQYEHASVLAPFQKLSSEEKQVLFLDPRLSPEEMVRAIPDDCYFVSLMYVNNELGTVLDIPRISKLLKQKRPSIILHCDAVQAFGKLPCKVGTLGVDLLTISAHKIYAPKGVGALYVRKGIRFTPLLYGGHQQKALRPGTESVPLIGGFGLASELVSKELPEHQKRTEQLYSLLIAGIAEIPEIILNSSGDTPSSIVNLSIPGIRSEIMLHFLEDKGIFVSSGSACARGEKSHVLSAIGLDAARIDSALRISFGRDNTKEDILALLETLKQGIRTIRRA